MSPITPAIIAAVEAAAHADKMDKLHFKPKHGIILYDSSQITGVDYNEDALENEDDPYHDDQDKDYKSKSESDEEFKADTDEEESESDDNTDVSEVPEVLTKTQEPVALTQEEEPQPQVLTQAQDNPIQDESNHRRSSQAKKKTHRMREYRAGIQHTQLIPEARSSIEYSSEEAFTYAYTMTQLKEGEFLQIKHATQHLVTYSLQRGIKKFGNKGHEAALSEMKQLHELECFKPINNKDVTKSDDRKAIEYLLEELKEGTELMTNHNDNGWTGKMSQVQLSAQNQH